MQLYTVLLGILCCLLPIVTGQASDAESRAFDFAGFGSPEEMDMMLSLLTSEPCLGENCLAADEPSIPSNTRAENAGDNEIPQPEYPSETADDYPKTTQEDYPENSGLVDGHSDAEHIEKTSLCNELILVVKEIEAQYPEFAAAKYELLGMLKSYSSFFSSELSRSSSEDVLTKLLKLFILIAGKVKADIKSEIVEKGKALEPTIPVVEDVKTEEIVVEEDEPSYPPIVGSVRGIPGEDYPDYSEVPITSFSCADKKYIPGFYADMETGCQVFHVCYEHRRESFLCPVGTTFNQPILACDYWYSSNCSLSPVYYDVNVYNKELSKQADEVESTIGELISTIIDGEKPDVPKVNVKDDSKHDVQDLGDLVKFLPVKATVVEFPETVVPKAKVGEIPNSKVDQVESKIVDQLVATTSHLVSETSEKLKAIPEPGYKFTEETILKPSLNEEQKIKSAKRIPLEKAVAKAKKIATTKVAAPIIAKAKLAKAAKIAVPVAKAKIAASVPIAKAAAAKMAIPVIAKAKMAAVPIAKVAVAKASVPIAAKAKMAAAAKVAVPVAAKAKMAAAAKVAVPVAAKAKMAAAAKVAVPVAAKAKMAAAAKVAVPVAAKAKMAAAAKVAVPVAAKVKMAAAAKVSVPVAAKAKKAAAVKVAVPVATKVKMTAAVPVAKAAAAKMAVPIAAKAKKAAVVSLPIVKTKFGKAAAVPVKGKMFALPLAKKKFAASGFPVIKAKKIPLVLAGMKPAAPLVKAKLAKAIAISPLTKKALALGYMKLLKAKKLAILG